MKQLMMRFKTLPACAPFFIAGAVFFLLAAGSFLWFLSSSDLDFVMCDGHYSFSASNPQCRHPAIAAALFAPTIVLAIVCLVAGIMKERRGKAAGSKSFLAKFFGYSMAAVAIAFSIASFIFMAYQYLFG